LFSKDLIFFDIADEFFYNIFFRGDNSMSYVEIRADILEYDDVLFNYLSGSCIEKSRRGDGVFVGGCIASDTLRQFGIILPKGGMIIPNDYPQRIKGLVFSERIRRNRLSSEEKLAEGKVLWDAFCERNDIDFFVEVYKLQRRLNDYFGCQSGGGKEPHQEIKVTGDGYFSWYSFQCLWKIAKGGLADVRNQGYCLRDIKELTFKSVRFAGVERPFSVDSLEALSGDVLALIDLHKDDPAIEKHVNKVRESQCLKNEGRSLRNVVIGDDCYFENGDNVLGRNVTVGDNCYFSTLASVGDGAIVGNNVTVIGAMVKPGTTVPDGTVLFQDEIYPPKSSLNGSTEIGNYTEVSEYHRYRRCKVVNSPKRANSIFCIGKFEVEVAMLWDLKEHGVNVKIFCDGKQVAQKFFEIISGNASYCLGEMMVTQVENVALANEVLESLVESGVSFPVGLICAEKNARYKQVPDPELSGEGYHRYKHYDKWCDNPFLPEHFVEAEVSDIDITVALHFM
jgi:hypothetical protein